MFSSTRSTMKAALVTAVVLRREARSAEDSGAPALRWRRPSDDEESGGALQQAVPPAFSGSCEV